MEVDAATLQQLRELVSFSQCGGQAARVAQRGPCSGSVGDRSLDDGKQHRGPFKEVFEGPLEDDSPNSRWELEPKKCSLC